MPDEPGPVQPRPAATVVLLRPGVDGPEVLLAHRPVTMAFAADMHVFPGGRVDPADSDRRLIARSAITPAEAAVALGGDLEPGAAHAAFVAAIRESFEEAGVLFADVGPAADLESARARLLIEPGSFPDLAERLDLRLRTDRLVPLSRWVTPPTMPRRFDTRFFAAALPDGAAASLVGDEVVAQAWHRPRAALDAMAAGMLGLWLPTSTTLQQLEHATSIDEIRERLTPGALTEVEVLAVAPDVVRIQMPAGGGVAGQPIHSYLVGREALVLVDPGDPTGPGLDRALAIAADRGGTIVAVALTHADPDHAAGAEAIAEQLGVAVHVGVGGARDLPYAALEMVDGDVLRHGDVPLRVIATPGPRTDHLAFVVGDGASVLSGDLDGPRGARSIPGPADEAAATRSIARLRSAAPGARWWRGHPA
ncbi:MAG TPA: MBL fold metallo-hydrolase [Candidatus Saccharimonadales bacterium]|nr:MBL fold metallo-hydrolase [Candidatus Saccharimonadales bacterium]